jgi:Calponin homology (CH) domain
MPHVSAHLQETVNDIYDALSPAPIQSSTSFRNSMRLTLSPSEVRTHRLHNNRRLAAEWILETTGVSVPAHSDAAFREALADGITLCQLLNAVQPGTISRVVDISPTGSTGDVIRTFENVSNFIIAAKRFTAESFSARDLEDEGDRPAVVDCILSLKNYACFGTLSSADKRSSMSYAPSSTPRPSACALTPSTSITPPPLPALPPADPETATGFTPSAAELVAKHMGHVGETRDGLTYLMRSCTHMLKSRMGMPATPLPPVPQPGSLNHPEIALDAVGPVLETVLANLTGVSVTVC